ncbi:hypothetical protein [Ruegeria sp. ANG-R]|uniref:hypothetical protein n=1 Tax=Ruegeria sp. ANG-R TaxID=1577903 RepID=UPI001269E69B|nr:hypothetical protein [Ruegeria sp. ANG-R]
MALAPGFEDFSFIPSRPLLGFSSSLIISSLLVPISAGMIFYEIPDCGDWEHNDGAEANDDANSFGIWPHDSFDRQSDQFEDRQHDQHQAYVNKQRFWFWPTILCSTHPADAFADLEVGSA